MSVDSKLETFHCQLGPRQLRRALYRNVGAVLQLYPSPGPRLRAPKATSISFSRAVEIIGPWSPLPPGIPPSSDSAIVCRLSNSMGKPRHFSTRNESAHHQDHSGDGAKSNHLQVSDLSQEPREQTEGTMCWKTLVDVEPAIAIQRT